MTWCTPKHLFGTEIAKRWETSLLTAFISGNFAFFSLLHAREVEEMLLYRHQECPASLWTKQVSFLVDHQKKNPTGFPSLKAETINLFVCLCGKSFFTSKNSCCPLKSCGQQPCCVSLTSWLQDINNTFTKAGWPSRKS